MRRTTELQALQWLGTQGIPVPRFVGVTGEPSDSDKLDFGPPWMLKPDLVGSGKGKAGLVRRCDEAALLLQEVVRLQADTGVPRVVVEEYIEGTECYLSVAMDEHALGPVIRVAGRGGIGFDASSKDVATLTVPVSAVPSPEAVERLLDAAGLQEPALRSAMTNLTNAAWKAFTASEATLLEMNPVRWNGQRACAVGVALEFDTFASPAARRIWPEVAGEAEIFLGRPLTSRERRVLELDAAEPNRASVKFFEIDGDIAFIILGGGASLVCFDYLYGHGLRPACFADYSPGAGLDKLRGLVCAGLSIPGIRGALLGSDVVSLADVFEIARGFREGIEASGQSARRIPMVVRLAGPNEEAAQAHLREVEGLRVVGRDKTLEEACDLLIKEISR